MKSLKILGPSGSIGCSALLAPPRGERRGLIAAVARELSC